MVSPRISTDQRVRELPCVAARLLFTWMIAHADNCGRLRAEAAYVRARVIPHEPEVSESDVAEWLAAMDRLGLVRLYEADGGQYLQLSGWHKNQRLDRQKHSDIPPPPPVAPVGPDREPLVTDRAQSVSGSGRGRGIGSRSEREEEVEVEEERGGAAKGARRFQESSGESRAHDRGCVCEECFERIVR